jgi:hypothetical protein
VLLFLRGPAWLRPETPDLTIRLLLQDRVLTEQQGERWRNSQELWIGLSCGVSVTC